MKPRSSFAAVGSTENPEDRNLLMRLHFVFKIVLVTLSMLIAGSAAAAEWKTVCDDKRCQLYQQIVTKPDNKLVSQLFLQKVPEKEEKRYKNVIKPNSIYGVLLLPLGLHIPSGVKVAIDDRLSFDAELIHCRPKEGCRATFVAQAATIDFMKRGAKLVVEIVDSESGQRINLTFPLKGFTAAFDEFFQKPL